MNVMLTYMSLKFSILEIMSNKAFSLLVSKLSSPILNLPELLKTKPKYIN